MTDGAEARISCVPSQGSLIIVPAHLDIDRYPISGPHRLNLVQIWF